MPLGFSSDEMQAVHAVCVHVRWAPRPPWLSGTASRWQARVHSVVQTLARQGREGQSVLKRETGPGGGASSQLGDSLRYPPPALLLGCCLIALSSKGSAAEVWVLGAHCCIIRPSQSSVTSPKVSWHTCLWWWLGGTLQSILPIFVISLPWSWYRIFNHCKHSSSFCYTFQFHPHKHLYFIKKIHT